MRNSSHTLTTKSRLLARLIRDLLREEKFASFADLTDALTCRCARLRITWTNDDITDAYRLIESNQPLILPRPEIKLRTPPPELPPTFVVPKPEAAEITTDLLDRYRREFPQ